MRQSGNDRDDALRCPHMTITRLPFCLAPVVLIAIGCGAQNAVENDSSTPRPIRFTEVARELGIDFIAITRFLMDTGYTGWIVVEDEADRAIPHPDEVATDDWTWLEKNLVPIVS